MYFQPNSKIVEGKFPPETTNYPTSTTRASSELAATVSNQSEMTSPQRSCPGRLVVRSAACPAPPRPTEAVFTLTLKSKPGCRDLQIDQWEKGGGIPSSSAVPMRHFSATDGPSHKPPSSTARERIGSTHPNKPCVRV